MYGATGYEVQIAASEAGLASAQSVEVSAASYTPSTGLTNNQTHYWRVRAKDGDGQSGAWSAVHSLSLSWGAVSGLSPFSTTDTTPALSWNAVPGAAGYEVQIAGSEAGLASAQAVEVSVASYTPFNGLDEQSDPLLASTSEGWGRAVWGLECGCVHFDRVILLVVTVPPEA